MCRQMICDNSDLYEKVLERLTKSDSYESRGEPILVRSWINTIDNADSSLLMTETFNTINKLATMNDLVAYMTIVTEITIILNNIFYSDNKSHKSFWKSNVVSFYYALIYTPSQSCVKEIKEIAPNTLDVNDYYHRFFTIFQDKCSRLGISIHLDEYYL